MTDGCDEHNELETVALLVETDNDGFHLFHDTRASDRYYEKKKRVAQQYDKPEGWEPDELNRWELVRREDARRYASEWRVKGIEKGRIDKEKEILKRLDERIEYWREKVEDTTGLDQVSLNDAKARREELEDFKQRIEDAE